MSLVAAIGVFVAMILALPMADPLTRLHAATRHSAWLAQLSVKWPYGVVLGLSVVIACVFGIAFGIAAGLVGATVAWLAGTYRRRKLAKRKQAAVADACRALAALLRVGHVPAAALNAVAQDAPVLVEVAAVQRIGGDVAPVLRRLAVHPGQAGMSELANAWEVAERTGASLTATLDALAERLVAQEEVRNIVRAELSAPRSTGRLLAALPAAGVAIGFFMGGDPVAFLCGSIVGQLVLVCGVALACAGLVWTERIAGADG